MTPDGRGVPPGVAGAGWMGDSGLLEAEELGRELELAAAAAAALACLASFLPGNRKVWS